MQIDKIYSKLERIEFTFDKADFEKLMLEKIKGDYPKILFIGKGIMRNVIFDWGDDVEENSYCIARISIEKDIEHEPIEE